MTLLSFAAKNHKSLRDEIVLDLRKRTLKTLQPAPGTHWDDHVYPFAAIFGPNATGKSSILDAFRYAFTAIRNSSTTWQARPEMPRAPFALDDHSRTQPSSYELDFVHEDRRYIYGFAVDALGVKEEWLRDLPGSRWRTLLSRNTSEGLLKLHSSVQSMGAVTHRELVLSRALVLEHPQLGAIASHLVSSFEFVSVKDEHRERRLTSITESLANGTITFDDIVTLLRVADIGVEHVTVREDTLPPEALQIAETFMKLVNSQASAQENESVEGEKKPRISVELESSDAVIRNLEFVHSGEGTDIPPFRIAEESDGTIAWLALVIPAVEALRKGGLLCVDEIDSSLHSHLLETLIDFFANPELNTRGAQLIFTSHDTYLLSPQTSVHLAPEQVWFTEKSSVGATELISLSDFPRHNDANVAKRYLSGRYGGIPRLAPSAVARILFRGDTDE